MKKNFFLLLISILIPFIILEIALIFFGKFQNLTNQNLIPSETLYERSVSSSLYYKHPDLDYTIQSNYDRDGVKNNKTVSTSEKKNIIAFFGDSMTENVGVNTKFEFSNILNNLISNYNIANYGIGGYSADQVFIRFLKYKHHDIKYIFYLLMPGDEIFSTKSEFNDDGTYNIHEPNLNIFFRLIGKLRLTYFFIDGYYRLKNLINKSYSITNTKNYNSILSNKLYQIFYHKGLNNCRFTIHADKVNCQKKLLNLLKIFNKEAKLNNIEFFVLVYPDLNFISYFKETLNMKKNEINYFILDNNLAYNKKMIFKNPNDTHWNEYGNIFYAQNILNIFSKINLNNKIINLNEYQKKIDLFYENNN